MATIRNAGKSKKIVDINIEAEDLKNIEEQVEENQPEVKKIHKRRKNNSSQF